MLYTKDGAMPEPIPFRIRMPDGRTRTDPDSFTPEEILAAGYVQAPDPPAFDATTHGLEWINGDWIVVALPPPPAVEPRIPQMSRFEFMGLLTTQERIALDTRAQSDPIMKDALRMLDLCNHVEPSHPMIAQMLGYVQQIGIMTAQRKAAFVVAMDAIASGQAPR